MTRKFEVQFSSSTNLSPSFVYISPSVAIQEGFAVGVLYVINKTGDFQSSTGIAKTFDFKQNLCKTEDEAILWAKQWLYSVSGVNVEFNEVTG